MGIFTRDESEQLNYDADAFWYFAATVLMVVLVPWTLFLVRWLLRPRPVPEEDFRRRGPGAGTDVKVRHCTVSSMEAKRRAMDERVASWRYRLGGSCKLQLLAVCMLWAMLFIVLWKLKDAPAQLKSFDPYAILGISADAESKEIKKAYRQKSLQHHPDKDIHNPLAHVQFQQIHKAYTALTDVAARQNYAKYGNPDGPQQMKVGIALHPNIMLSKEIQITFLCVFFFVLFFVPCTILCCCLRGQRLSHGGISADTLKMIHACIDEETKAEHGPSLLGASHEAVWSMSAGQQAVHKLMLTIMRVRPTPIEPGIHVEAFSGPLRSSGSTPVARGVVRRNLDDKKVEIEVRDTDGEMKQFPLDHVAPLEPKAPCIFCDGHIRRNVIIIWAHLWRLHDYMEPAVRSELDALLRHSVGVCKAMVFAASSGHDQAVFGDVCRDMVSFRRCLVQALDVTNVNELLQLPHVQQSMLTSQVMKGAPSLREIVSGGRSDFINKLGLRKEQILDIDDFCRNAPLVELSCHVEVQDEESISVTDVATLTVTLTRTHLSDGEAAGIVHAPIFPVPKFEEWWIFVFDERDRRLITVDCIVGTGRVEKKNINFMVPRAGEFRWKITAMCDSYAGLDASCPFTFSTVKRSEVPREIFVHPEDKNIRTFFEDLMLELNPEVEEESESEEDLPPRPSSSQKKNGHAVAKQGCAEVAPEEEVKPKITHLEECDDSECEGQCEAFQEPDGSFFEVISTTGAFLHREPSLEEEARIGSVPCGMIIRAFDSSDQTSSPSGWAELSGARGAWLHIGEPDAVPADASAARSDNDVCVKRLAGLLELPLRSVVQTRTPLILLKRWCKKATAEITRDDVMQIAEIEETRIRMMIEELIRERVGDKRYEALLDESEVEISKRQKRILKARGHFVSPNGILWHVDPRGQVRGLHPDGSKIRDRVYVSKEDQIRIGPFYLDESRSCSCIHWHRKDDPESAWVWARDTQIASRLRMGSW